VTDAATWLRTRWAATRAWFVALTRIAESRATLEKLAVCPECGVVILASHGSVVRYRDTESGGVLCLCKWDAQGFRRDIARARSNSAARRLH